MNVTNRRKSTDADTPTTQPNQQQQQQQQQQQHQQQQHQPLLLSYVSCRQAATTTATTTTTRARQVQQVHNFQQRAQEENDDQEQVVTSTSSDCLLPLCAEGEGEEVTLELEALVTSPARITSSTNNYDILTYNSDSLSLEEMVMPSTSENSRLQREGTSTSSTTLKAIHHSINNTRFLKSNSDMVARDITPTAVADAAGDSGGSVRAGVDGGDSRDHVHASTSSNSSSSNTDLVNESHKIILKLPKPSSSGSESQHNSLTEDDLRKVEPLKINLHNTHHNLHHTPKITIKPIVKDPSDILMSSEECSSSAEDEIVSKLSASEPHIVPKLTIRSQNEEHSTIVPKLTIKISDSSNANSDVHNTQPAANTPPLPKLTIKTGQDGQSESIITNISPASSTTSSSSSSLASSSTNSSTSTNSLFTTNSSSANVIPKLTIKPLQKSHEDSNNDHHPSIPKLCIKGNMICAETNVDDASTSKIPKLTIKTGQEHAVIITQHNDHVNASGGIPKLTIKTKSLDLMEDSTISNSNPVDNMTNEKIPKITIKTNTNSMDSPNIVVPKRSVIKSQLETNPSSPKQAVPKLTITRQQNDMVVTNKHIIAEEDSLSIPKMTIKTQNKLETVPKLTIKHISSQQRPVSTEESGISDNAEKEENVEEGLSNSVKVQHCKIVPKLTIKNLGSPQQKLSVVQESSADIRKNTTNIVSSVHVASLSSNLTVSSPIDADEFADLLTVDNAGGESSNSQEFCGFNDNTVDSASKVLVLSSNNEMMDIVDNNSELRCNSDDMDIDEDLQTDHEPQIFKNDIHYKNPSQNLPDLLNGKIEHPKEAQIIDTVDLTSSPSCSSSPPQFAYNEESNSNMLTNVRTTTNTAIPSTNILLERLQRDTSVIQNTQQLKQQQLLQLQQLENNCALPPPLHPKPNAIQIPPPACLKYPQLAERLMANGTSPNTTTTVRNTHNLPPQNLNFKEENIIDSIEILDTPEGSPRNFVDESSEILKAIKDKVSSLPNGLHYPKESELISHINNNSNLKRHALATNLAGQINYPLESMETIPPSKQRRLNSDTKNSPLIVNNDLLNQKVLLNSLEELNKTKTIVTAQQQQQQQQQLQEPLPQQQSSEFNCFKQNPTIITSMANITSHHRARKQKHENLIPIPMEEVVDSMQINSNDNYNLAADKNGSDQTSENVTPVVKKRGRPKRITNANNEVQAALTTQMTTTTQKDESMSQADLSSKSRRVQLLRKRLAIDMVDADEPLRVLDELESAVNSVGGSAIDEQKNENNEMDGQRKEHNLRTPLRTSRRSNTPTVLQMETKTKVRIPSALAMDNNSKKSLHKQHNENVLNHFLESNSSISSVCSNTLTSTVAPITSSTINAISMATQIDLTMSSSSSNSNGSTTNTITTVEAPLSKQGSTIAISGTGIVAGNNACKLNTSIGNSCNSNAVISSGGSSSNNSMLPPTTILSSEPLPDVVFKPNDFSSILATQQLRTPLMLSGNCVQSVFQGENMVVGDISTADNSGDDSASSSSMSTTPGRGRGRGRGSRGGRGRGYRAHRLGRGASAISKAIAMNRPRCVGALKHTPDPERIKGLYSPSPSVFEEDTRMSADFTQNNSQLEPPKTPTRQPDFLNNEESQSSIISNTSILDPNNVAAALNGSATKKPMKRKKMEVCVSEEAEFTVASIAEYDWPPPKGCCPSKNRDTFMIQEQVALYLGIKSFKRKYPDLPRRQIDMEERNYLQEKSLVTEKMCDLGITAVWASDILDIMYTDFSDKYEEYKDFVRQKHLREIEAKQKSLGLNVAGRGLQARDRAMLSASKWNTYLNRTRKEERVYSLDLQTLTINKPSPASAPISAIPNRPVAEAIVQAVSVEKIPQPPTLLKQRVWEPIRPRDSYYPLSLVPGQFCEKYYDYSAQELRKFPLNTILDCPNFIYPSKEDSSDTDSAIDTIDFADGDKAPSISASERLNQQRRIRRIRAKHTRKLNNDEFKVPPLPGANSSTDTYSSSSDSSSDTDSESSCSSSSSESSSDDETSPAACGVCHHSQNRNLKDIPELFVQCYTCRSKVHPSCIEMPHRMAIRVRNYNWQCADCKCCIKCKRTQDQNKMLFCEQCDRGFHIYCISIKAVPDGRWSCDRCSICMRCGATRPEGLPIIQSNGEKSKVKHRKLKWINEYRIDHITKLREHCSMLCVPCGRAKSNKRVQMNSHNNTTNTYIMSSGSSSALSPNNYIQSPTSSATSTLSPQMSPTNTTATAATAAAAAKVTMPITTTTNYHSSNNATIQISNANTTTSTLSTGTRAITANSLECKDFTTIIDPSFSFSNTITPQTVPIATTAQTFNTTNTTLPLTTTAVAANIATTTTTTSATLTTGTSLTTNTTTSGGPPPVVA